MAIPQDINSARPFEKGAYKYLDNGWYPMPIPKGKKHPPPTGYTGRGAKYADRDQIETWADEGKKNWNIALHLGPVYPPPGEDDSDWLDQHGNPLWTVAGIDVDDYVEKDKKKEGGKELAALEEELGKLPETWISSSRSDGVSGIRYYLVPTEYAYRGQVDNAIEFVQETHRYAMVYPSYHPLGGQYVWYRPGCAPNGQPSGVLRALVAKVTGSSSGSLSWRKEDNPFPTVWALPKLSDPWIKYLSRDYVRNERVPIDMDTSYDDLRKWALKAFRNKAGGKGDPELTLQDVGCKMMKQKVADWKTKINEDATSHDKIVGAHWNVLSMGLEGHAGWWAATRALENYWMNDVGEQQKRGVVEAKLEMFRSKANALRKIKGKVEESDVNLLGRMCGCYEADDEPDDGGEFVPRGKPRDPGEYERNDNGNAEHFLDLYGGDFRYVAGYDKWIFWDGRNWRWDEKGLVRRAFNKVQKRQRNYAVHLWSTALAQGDEDAVKAAKQKAKVWEEWALRSGNVNQISHALDAATSFADVTVGADVPDGRYDLLGVSNGVIHLDVEHGFSFRQAERDDWVVNNTGTPYIPTKEQLGAGGTMAEGVRLWQSYLNLFLPDKDVRLWTQQLLGYTLFGRNVEKKLIFLYGDRNTGKSTMLNAIMSALGQYAGSVEMSIFSGHKLNPALGRALPMRVITTTEAAGDKDISGEMMKRMTGDDPMTVEYKGSNDIVQRYPAFVPIIGTNNAPEIGDVDAALRDRTEILPFDISVPKSRAGVDLMEHASAAVLAWLLEGWNLYAANKLANRPTAKLQSTAERFGNEMAGDIGAFLEEVCEITDNPDDVVYNPAMYGAYQKWTKLNNIQHPWSSPVFGKRMTKAGHPSINGKDEDNKSVKLRTGIKLKESWGNVLSFKVTKE